MFFYLNLETTQSPNIFNDKSLPVLPSTPGTLTRTLDLQELFNSTTKPSVITNLSQSFMDKSSSEIKTPIKTRVDSFNEQIATDLVLTPAFLKQNGNSTNGDQRQSSPPILSSQQPEPLNSLYRPTPTTNQFNSTNDFISSFQARPTSINQTNLLTMEQLKQTLIHLLQNDADFLHSIHTAYTEVQNKFY